MIACAAAGFLVCVLLLGSCVAVPYPNAPLMHIVATGSPYAVGMQVGHATQRMIATRLAEPGVVAIWEWMIASDTALAVNKTLFDASIAAIPEAIEEMRGIADGALQPFDRIWFLNTHVEFQTLQQQLNVTSAPLAERTAHCTDVFAASPAGRVWGHNEDGSRKDQNHTYVVTVNTTYGDGLFDNYTSFAYAGSLGGGSFAVTQHGLIITDNSLFPNTSAFIGRRLLPERLLHRLVFRARSLGEALSVLASHVPSTAFSYNIGTWDRLVREGELSFVNVEMDPMGTLAITRVDPCSPLPPDTPGALPSASCHGYHANMYLKLTTAQGVDPSSVARLARLDVMGEPNSTWAVRQRLGDTADAEYPLYRTYSDVDPVLTLATAVFHLDAERLEIYTANPKFADPVITVALSLK
jgi:hypothetical protein